MTTLIVFVNVWVSWVFFFTQIQIAFYFSSFKFQLKLLLKPSNFRGLGLNPEQRRACCVRRMFSGILLSPFYYLLILFSRGCSDASLEGQKPTGCNWKHVVNLAIKGVGVFRELEVEWGRREHVSFPHSHSYYYCYSSLKKGLSSNKKSLMSRFRIGLPHKLEVEWRRLSAEETNQKKTKTSWCFLVIPCVLQVCGWLQLCNTISPCQRERVCTRTQADTCIGHTCHANAAVNVLWRKKEATQTFHE